MPGQAIAFYTTGDTRRLGSLPTAGGRSAASGAGRNDTETVSNVYRRYASALSRFQLELRGYENYYAIIPSGRRFRSEIHSRGAGRVLAFANGTRAPDAELHACVVRGGGFIEGAACP